MAFLTLRGTNTEQKRPLREKIIIACNIALSLTNSGFKKITKLIVCSLQVQRNNTEGREGYECQ